MPEWLAVVALGLIEGVTEFLPISSTGHLLLVQGSGWLPRQSDLFNIGIQSGTAVSVAVAFAGRLRDLVDRRHEAAARSFMLKLVAAFTLTAAGGLVLKRVGVTLPRDVAPVAWATLLGGVAILLVEWAMRGRAARSEVTWAVALAVGAAQLFAAVFPGTSRAGATILVALALGLTRSMATEFSFLLGVPTLLAAGGYEALQVLQQPARSETSWGMIALGTVVSALAALVAVRWLLRFIQTHTFMGFGWYRVALGLLILTGVPHGA